MNSAHGIVRATRDYEVWLASRVRVVRADLRAKHRLMAEDGFSFLCATFYRWALIVPRAVSQTGWRAKGFGHWRFAR